MALRIERCPETGICSLVRPAGEKIDLLPDEVAEIRDAAGDPARVRGIIASSDAGFAAGLDAAEMDTIIKRLS